MISVHDLTRRYGDTTVVDRVSFDVHPGRTTGFVGANGAGKTTTMRMIMGVLGISAGEVRWNGSPITSDIRRSFGYMPEERGLYPRMTLTEQLVFFAQLHGMDSTTAHRRVAELLEHFDLGDRSKDLLDELSLGNQQRVQIAAAVVHHPMALVLDEPFSGLDPLAVDTMVELLQREASGLPLLFSTHQLDLVERLCDDLVILSRGRVVAAGPVEDLRSRGGERYRVVFENSDAAWLRDLRGISVVDVDGPQALVELDGMAAGDLTRAVADRAPVIEVARIDQSLTEIFREAVQ